MTPQDRDGLIALAEDWLRHATGRVSGWGDQPAVPIALVGALRAALVALAAPVPADPPRYVVRKAEMRPVKDADQVADPPPTFFAQVCAALKLDPATWDERTLLALLQAHQADSDLVDQQEAAALPPRGAAPD